MENNNVVVSVGKRNEEKITEFIQRMGQHPKRESAIEYLQSLSGFGLCRAHAVNLGRLIWALAYQKAHNKEEFWRACLKHCQGSYRRWVHKTEAKRVLHKIQQGFRSIFIYILSLPFFTLLL